MYRSRPPVAIQPKLVTRALPLATAGSALGPSVLASALGSALGAPGNFGDTPGLNGNDRR